MAGEVLPSGWSSTSMSSMARRFSGTGRGEGGGVGTSLLPGGRITGCLSLLRSIAGSSGRGVGAMNCQGSGLKFSSYLSLFFACLTLSSRSSLPNLIFVFKGFDSLFLS